MSDKQFKICNSCKIACPMNEYKCSFRVKSAGFKNCIECRKNYKSYYSKKPKNPPGKIEHSHEHRKCYKQCVSCIYLFSSSWECIHEDEDRYLVYSDKKRTKMQSYEDYDDAMAFFFSDRDENNRVRKASNIKPKLRYKNDRPININKFTIRINI